VGPLRAVAAPLLIACAGCFGCVHEPDVEATAPPRLERRDVVARLPPKLVDREGWADDILAAIVLTGKAATAERVCAVIAVIEQESGFQADPVVKDLPGIVRRGLDDKLDALGPLREPAVSAVYAMKAPGSELTFERRIASLRTERDLDRLFRDVASGVRAEAPGGFALAQAFSLLFRGGGLDALNPVTTAGSMQVKVDFAKQLNPDLSDESVRELLYTRGGGVRTGTARLIGYAASYDDVVYRFADYNAGVYASRNAAFQQMVEDLTGIALDNDGDLLIYNKNGEALGVDSKTVEALLAFGARHDLSSWTIHRDVKKEKDVTFEQTDTWKSVRMAWTAKATKPAPYAQVPEVALTSPKMTKPRTTSWFADSVKQRYLRCRG